MDVFRALAERWRGEAASLERYGDSPAATACRLHAAELEAAIGAALDDLLAPADAAELAGVSERTLRNWRATGRLDNHGTDARPLYRRGDLPARGGAPGRPGGYDPAADARRIAA
jgi:hypothetical protein